MWAFLKWIFWENWAHCARRKMVKNDDNFCINLSRCSSKILHQVTRFIWWKKCNLMAKRQEKQLSVSADCISQSAFGKCSISSLHEWIQIVLEFPEFSGPNGPHTLFFRMCVNSFSKILGLVQICLSFIFCDLPTGAQE